MLTRDKTEATLAGWPPLVLLRNHQQRKKKMDCKFNLGQLVDRHFDALPAKYERAEISKLSASGITMIEGGNIKTTTPNPCYGRIDYVQALLNDVILLLDQLTQDEFINDTEALFGSLCCGDPCSFCNTVNTVVVSAGGMAFGTLGGPYGFLFGVANAADNAIKYEQNCG